MQQGQVGIRGSEQVKGRRARVPGMTAAACECSIAWLDHRRTTTRAPSCAWPCRVRRLLRADAPAEPLRRHAPRCLPAARQRRHAKGGEHAHPGRTPGEAAAGGLATAPFPVHLLSAHTDACICAAPPSLLVQGCGNGELMCGAARVQSGNSIWRCFSMWLCAVRLLLLTFVCMAAPLLRAAQGMLSPQAAGEREAGKRRAESPIPEDGERHLVLAFPSQPILPLLPVGCRGCG